MTNPVVPTSSNRRLSYRSNAIPTGTLLSTWAPSMALMIQPAAVGPIARSSMMTGKTPAGPMSEAFANADSNQMPRTLPQTFAGGSPAAEPGVPVIVRSGGDGWLRPFWWGFRSER